MKTLKNILALSLITFIISGAIAQNEKYLEILDPIYLSQKTDSATFLSSYEQLNKEIIEKGTFNFSSEIKEARKNNELLILNGNENATSIEKAEYLIVLRKAANRSDTVVAFQNYLNNHIAVLETLVSSRSSISQLYNVTRKNTRSGSLEKISTDLSWL